MSRAGKSQAAEDLWHLSISDLLAAPKERAPLPGDGPVVINLSTSTAQIGPPPKGLRRFEGLHLYQLRRGPEDEPQYLLRLGIIATDIEADAILASLLEHYPGATKASPGDDDRAAIAARERAAKEAKSTPALPPPSASAASVPRATPGGRQGAAPPARKGSPTPPVSAPKAQEPIRWDIDELLPGLAVTRPPQPKPAPSKRTKQAAARAERAAGPASATTPASPSAPARSIQPAAATSEQPAAPAPNDAIEITLEAPAISVPERIDPPAPEPRSEAPAAAIEFTLPAPEPAAKSPPQAATEIDGNYDSDAITHEVPLPTFEFDAVEIEASPASVPEAQVARESAPTLQRATHEEPPTIEVETASAESFTFEVQSAPAAPPTSPATSAAEEPPTVEVVSVRAEEEPPTIEVLAAAHADEEPPTIEVQTAARAVEEPPTIEVQAAASPNEEPPTVEVQTAATVSARVQAPAIAQVVAAEHAAEPAAPPVAPAADTQAETLEHLVAKIDAMVDSVDQHGKDDPTPAPPPPSHVPHIERTQTVRALTPLELSDDQASPWFSIQLVFSEEQIDPEQVPDLDLFDEYRLYSVTGLHEDRIMHALRLGFFSSELAAEAVAGYLRGFFDEPCIKRVSIAERERFAEQCVTPRKDIGATGVHAVIELTSPKSLPERQAPITSQSTNETRSSIWSRLVAPLKR